MSICLSEVWQRIKEFWFLHAYIVLMVFAPIVDVAIEQDGVKMVVPICLLVFGWSFAQTLPFIGGYVPTSPGLINYSGITLLGTYAVARMYRIMDFENKWKLIPVALAFVGLLALSSVGLCEYHSPVAAGLACCGFFLVSRIKFNPFLARIVFFVAPSMFAVYIISVGGGWGVIEYFVRKFESTSLLLAASIAGVAVFLFSLILDLPRRLLTYVINKPVSAALGDVDDWYAKVVGRMGTARMGK